MKMKTEKHYSCEWFWNYKPVRKCHNVTKTITHYKKKPECTKVPKYHCEEKWEVDDYGKKVCRLNQRNFTDWRSQQSNPAGRLS